jgi:hypothetical protein
MINLGEQTSCQKAQEHEIKFRRKRKKANVPMQYVCEKWDILFFKVI